MPALDNPDTDRDAAGENLSDPDRRTLGDALATRKEKADRERDKRRDAREANEEMDEKLKDTGTDELPGARVGGLRGNPT